MNNCLTSSIEYIFITPPGTMICDVVDIGPFNIAIAFLIKETPLHFSQIIQKDLDIDMRSRLFVLGSVMLVTLLIQVNHNPNMTYQTWFNYQSEYVKQYFDYLTIQDQLNLLFFTNDYLQIFIVNNGLQLGFMSHLQLLKNSVPWSIIDFEQSKSKLLKIFPTTISLWNGLKKGI